MDELCLMRVFSPDYKKHTYSFKKYFLNVTVKCNRKLRCPVIPLFQESIWAGWCTLLQISFYLWLCVKGVWVCAFVLYKSRICYTHCSSTSFLDLTRCKCFLTVYSLWCPRTDARNLFGLFSVFHYYKQCCSEHYPENSVNFCLLFLNLVDIGDHFSFY